MSADDDIFIHMPNLVAYLQSLAQMGVQDLWIGRVHRGSPPVRDKTSKYYVPYEMYQWPSYPDYTAGAAYVISNDVAAKVYEASQTLNTSLYIDDVFMGLCANKMGIVPQYHVFFSGEGKAPYHPCIYNKMMTSHGHVDDLHQLWKQATDPKVKRFSSGFFGRIYCKIVNIVLLCKLYYEDTYPCSAAFS
nr:PREDICTED: lactosylceramide 1,3-N-acetyl-beta-D-glucosaminyltransferase-like [Apteryx mantelli mantelli]